MESNEDTIIRMKKEGKTFDDVCDHIARRVGYDDTISYDDILELVGRYWDSNDAEKKSDKKSGK